MGVVAVPRPLQSVVRRLGLDSRSREGRASFRRERKEFMRQLASSSYSFAYGREWPIIADRFDQAGTTTGQYFHQDLVVAQAIFKACPERHADVGSRVDGFVAHVASFREIEVFDIRPLEGNVANITYVRRDITAPDPEFDGRYDSVSCLHAIEHFGLGRYGDPIDADGWLKAWTNLARMVAPGGVMYLSAPIGRIQRVEFNAHRVFNLATLLQIVRPTFIVEHLAVVDDAGDLVADCDPNSEEARRSFDFDSGLAILTLRRDADVPITDGSPILNR